MTKPPTKAQIDRYELEADRSFQEARKAFRADLHDMLDNELDITDNQGVPMLLQLMAGALAGNMEPKIMLILVDPEADTVEEEVAPKIEVVRA